MCWWEPWLGANSKCVGGSSDKMAVSRGFVTAVAVRQSGKCVGGCSCRVAVASVLVRTVAGVLIRAVAW